jgi:hypothetical protein
MSQDRRFRIGPYLEDPPFEHLVAPQIIFQQLLAAGVLAGALELAFVSAH